MFDGWPLVLNPANPAAVHLQELLEALPSEVEPWLALPAELESLPAGKEIQWIVKPVSAGHSSARLRWEQFDLPHLAQQTGCCLLHITTLRPPLWSSVPCLVSPAEYHPRDLSSPGMVSRLGEALGLGGLSAANGVLWPDDLPTPAGFPGKFPLFRLPPRVHSSFLQAQPRRPFLPADYVFVPGPLTESERHELAAVWRWISTGLGDDWVLLISDLPAGEFERFNNECQAMDITTPLINVSLPLIEERAAAIQYAAAILQLKPVLPWGDGLLQAIACARPLAAEETPSADARVGPAGYLTSQRDPRKLASAVLTPLVEETVSEQLSQAARERFSSWGSANFSARLLQIYMQIAGITS
jgi:hypothetical protein